LAAGKSRAVAFVQPMRPRTRNGLAVVALLLLVAGIVAALVHDGGAGPKRSPIGAAQLAPGAIPTTVAGSTATTAMTRQPRTGGPGTLPVGLLLVAAGLVALRFHAAAVRALGDEGHGRLTAARATREM
jgi:hypothetical protein